MMGDFSRICFEPARQFSRVLMQQGRMMVDADFNEQQAINLHLLRMLAADLIGAHGGPGDSFKIEVDAQVKNNFSITGGRYYVNGWPCLNDGPVAYRPRTGSRAQPSHPDAAELGDGSYVVYLTTWERDVSAADYDRGRDPAAPDAIRDVALGGPDSTARGQQVWQVHALPVQIVFDTAGKPKPGPWLEWLETVRPRARGMLRAKAAEPPAAGGPPCEVSPRSRFRGGENRLYRVEIRRGGVAKAGKPTFVFSGDNGSVTFAVERIAGAEVTLAGGWRDARFALAPGDIVEVAAADAPLGGPSSLHRVEEYDPDSDTILLDATPDADTDDPSRPVLLRRWDHGAPRGPLDGRPKPASDNALDLVEGKWLTLEDGIAIEFAEDPNEAADYQPGDYWLIPARIALGDVLWPRDASPARAPLPLPPHGIDRQYAPLAVINVANGVVTRRADLRRVFDPIAKPAP